MMRAWSVWCRPARFDYWSAAIDDYDETAALVTALDLVISVQTAVVHLAGALGKPAWVRWCRWRSSGATCKAVMRYRGIRR
jgi:hypothetical protein